MIPITSQLLESINNVCFCSSSACMWCVCVLIVVSPQCFLWPFLLKSQRIKIGIGYRMLLPIRGMCMQCTHLSTILYNIEHIYKIYQIQFLSFSHSINLSISISQSALSQHVYCIVYTQSTAQSTTPAFRPFV